MTEPFIITCETCRGRLRVRSLEAIGSILACPRCQSLVQVVPPEPDAEVAEQAPEPPQAALPGATSSRSAWLALALTGGAIVAAMTVSLVREGDDAAYEGAARSVAAREETWHEPAKGTPGAPTDADGGHSKPTSEVASPPPRGATESGEDAPPKEEVRQGPPRLPQPVSTDERPVRHTHSPVDQQPPLPPVDDRKVPPVGVPDLDLVLSADGPPTSPQEPPPVPPESGTTVSEDLGPGVQSRHEAAPPFEAPEAPASSLRRMGLERVQAAEQRHVPLDPGQALSLPLVEASLSNASPVELVRVMSNLTGVSITLTPEAYLALQRSPTEPASPHHSETSAGRLLASFLKERGLRIEQRGQHVVIVPQAAVGGDGSDATRGAAKPHDALEERLRRRVTYSFTEASPFCEVLWHLERASGVTLLVDWESLASAGYSPHSPVTSSVLDVPLQEVLDGLLPPLKMEWRPVASDAVWITSREGRRMVE